MQLIVEFDSPWSVLIRRNLVAEICAFEIRAVNSNTADRGITRIIDRKIKLKRAASIYSGAIKTLFRPDF
jgi:hypothetical protein